MPNQYITFLAKRLMIVIIITGVIPIITISNVAVSETVSANPKMQRRLNQEGNRLIAYFSDTRGMVPLDKIDIEEFLPAVEYFLALSQKRIDEIKAESQVSFDNTFGKLEAHARELTNVIQILSHIFRTNQSNEIFAIQQTADEKYTQFATQVKQDRLLYAKLLAAQQSPGRKLDKEDLRLMELTLRDFKMNGVDLDNVKQEQLQEVLRKWQALQNLFDNNILEHVAHNFIVIKDLAELQGCQAMVEKHLEKQGEEYRLKIVQPVIIANQFCEVQSTREKIWRGWRQRALGGNYSNEPVISSIVKLRAERASLVGFNTYADFSLSEKMAKKVSNVTSLIAALKKGVAKPAQNEFTKLKAKSKAMGDPDFFVWDAPFYGEVLKREEADLDENVVKQYLPLSKVFKGIQKLVRDYFGFILKEEKSFSADKNIQLFKVVTVNGKLKGYILFDLFTRDKKRAGAWSGGLVDGALFGKSRVLVQSVVANFPQPDKNETYLYMNDVSTLFHELGHALHFISYTGKYPNLNGQLWDFIEFPSTFLENWAYDEKFLAQNSKHQVTGKPLSKELIANIKKNRDYLIATFLIKQISMAELDLKFTSTNEVASAAKFETDFFSLHELTKFYLTAPGTCLSCSFAHIFSGGYAAGYYSYIWSEVISSDAFDIVKTKGKSAMKNYLQILESGQIAEPLILYRKAFGRDPSPAAYLRRLGLELKDLKAMDLKMKFEL